ncbi:MAG TPA: ATP-binding protein [Thermodesulfovibrionia bacterium]|nr:ATP-binding protein [Thermodesulfovibrionia bacterium]
MKCLKSRFGKRKETENIPTGTTSPCAAPPSLSRNITISLLLGTFVPLILIAGILLFYFQRAYREEVIAHIVALVKNHRNIIDGFLRNHLDDTRQLVHSNGIEKLMNHDFLNDRLTFLQKEYGSAFVDIGLIDDQGILAAYAGSLQMEKVNYSDETWYKEAVSRDYYISDVFPGTQDVPYFIIAVKEYWRGKTWIVRSTINFKSFNYLVDNMRLGTTGMAFIMNRDGELQSNPPLPFLKDRKVCRQYLASQVNTMDGNDFKVFESGIFGKKCVFILTPIKHGEWILVFQQDAGEAFSEIYHARNLTIIIFFIGLIGVIKTILLSRRVLNQLVGQVKLVCKEKEAINEQFIKANKLSSLGELAAGVAHEINNPVAIMVEEAGWIEDLMEEESNGSLKNYDEIKQSLTQIRTQGKRCKDITHQLLSFARKTESKVEALKLNNLIKEIVALSEQRARYRNVKIETELDQFLPAVSASPSEMQQVLLNLINNAFDAIDSRGGTVTIASRVETDNIVIDISDTGEGIPEENVPKLFDPFFTTKSVGKGSGLGLSICYGIIRKIGGEIKVDSNINVSTTFHVYIPRNRKKNTSSTENGL